MMKKFLTFFLSAFLLIGCLGFAACGTEKGEAYTVTLSNEAGVVLYENRARAGELVSVEAVKEGYTVRALYVNGEYVEGDSFVMPSRNVAAVAVLANTSETAHTVSVSETGEFGRTVADYTSAEAGEMVTLTTYVAYGCSLEKYLVNGEAIEGNTFAMPNEDVVVTALYNSLPETDVMFTVSQSFQNATSRWYAGYTENGFSVDVVVDDNILFTSTKYLSSFTYADNVEFIFGPKTSETGWDGRFKVIVDAEGRSEIRRYMGGWVLSAVKINVTVSLCTLEKNGFNGYKVNVFVPYSELGLDYETALGNFSIAPAMRNTLNGLKTAWASYAGMHCNWNDSKTHLVVGADGTLSPGDFRVEALFAGGGLFSPARWSNFYSDVGALGDVYSIAGEGRDTAYWREHLDSISSVSPETVYFPAELGGRTPIAAFSDFVSFAQAFGTAMPNVRLVVVSGVPSLSDADPAAAKAFAGMLEDYASHEGWGFIDLCGAVYEGKLNRVLYASATALSEDGYALLGKLIREEEGVYAAVGGSTWGDSGAYVASGNWRESGNTLALRSDGIRKIYYRTPLSGDFTLSLELNAATVYNGDAYPKFGFTVQNGDRAHAFYISGENGLTAMRAGYVPYTLGTFVWEKSAETAVPGLAYSGSSYATLRFVRSGGIVSFYVNDTCVYSGDLGYGKGEAVVGLFSFNTELNIRNWQSTAGGVE